MAVLPCAKGEAGLTCSMTNNLQNKLYVLKTCRQLILIPPFPPPPFFVTFKGRYKDPGSCWYCLCCVFTTDVSEHIKCWYCSCHCVSSGGGGKKQTNMTLFFPFWIVMKMQDNMKALGPEQARSYLDTDALVVPPRGQSNVSQHAFRGRQGNARCRSDTLVWGMLIKAKHLKKLQPAALETSYSRALGACWKYPQPRGGIFIVMLRQLVLGYSSEAVSDGLLLSNIVILHSSSAHGLIMRMYLARPKARLITINRVQGKASYRSDGLRKDTSGCTKRQEHRIKNKNKTKRKGVAYTNKPRVDTQVEQLQLVAA